MKKILMLLLIISSGVYADDCSETKTAHEAKVCLNKQVNHLKFKLDKVFHSALGKTEAKPELIASQKKWLAYKEQQCGDFIVADTGGSPVTIEYDLYCQSILYQQRISLLLELFN